MLTMLAIARWRWVLTVTTGLVFLSPPASANMILSVFHGAAAVLILALIPVIVVEAIVLCVYTGVSFGSAIVSSAVANLASTTLGIPLADSTLKSVLRVGPKPLKRIAQAVLVLHGDFDHGPIDDRGEILGLLATCVLFYCGSCAIEYVVLVGVLTPVHGANVFAATIWANTWSYGLIALSVVTLLVTFLITKRARRSSPS